MIGHFEDNRMALTLQHQPVWLQHAFALRTGRVPDDDMPRAPRYALWLPALCAWWGDAATVHDGRLVTHALLSAGLAPPARWWLLRSWLEWGINSASPAIGALVVVHRRGLPWVGLMAGADDQRRAIVLAALPGQPVQLLPVEQRHVLCYRWPAERAALREQYLQRWMDEPATVPPAAATDDDDKDAT
jgi:hypothetical protein